MSKTTDIPDLTGLSPKKILLCQQRQIGDVVLATPAIKILQKEYPESEIHFLTEKKCVPVLENNSRITRIWVLDKGASLLERLRLLWDIRREKFDLVVDFQQLPRCKSAVLFSGAPVRLTYTPKWYNRFVYTHWSKMLGGYAVKAKMSVLRPLGFQWADERPEMVITDAERNCVENFLDEYGVDENEHIVTVDSTHWSDTRRWPAIHYAGLIDLLVEQRPNLKFVLLYGPGEREQAQAVLDAVHAKEHCIFPEEQLNIRKTAALMEHACLHLGNCSAPRHFALAVKTPTFTIIGSNSGRSWTYPGFDQTYVTLRVECARCQRNSCQYGTIECLNEFYPEVVLPLVLKELSVEPE